MVAWVDGYEHAPSERAGLVAPLHGFGWLAAGLPVRSWAAEATFGRELEHGLDLRRSSPRRPSSSAERPAAT